MAKTDETKKITISLDYSDGTLNLDFSHDLTDEKEQGYILSAAFFSFAANHGITKEQMVEMIQDQYGKFTGEE